jgi:hypothetical protein
MDLLRSYGDIAQALSEADVEAQRDGVRGQVAGEYNRLYQYCMTNLGEDAEGNTDVRFAELAVRILDRVVKVYRLDRPSVTSEPDEEAVEVATERRRAAVSAQLDQLAGRQSTTRPA